MDKQKTLIKALSRIGSSYEEVAHKLRENGHPKMTSSRISTWVQRDKKCPANMVYELISLGVGGICAHQLRPDIYKKEAS